MYDARNPTAFSEQECANAIGTRVTLTLTGTIVSYDVSESGPFVRVQLDERWGFGDYKLGIDLDALVRESSTLEV